MKNIGDSKEAKKIDDIFLFSTNDNVIAVNSPVKMKILSLLSDNTRSFDELVAIIGKAKSTISVHLKSLEESGLVISSIDPKDMRKRIITLNSAKIGKLTNEDRDAKERDSYTAPEIKLSNGDPISLFRYIFKTIRSEAMRAGINIDPVFFKAGLQVGNTITSKNKADSLKDLVSNLNTFWQANSLGKIEMVQNDPVILIVTGCFECENLPLTGHGTCAFDSGVLTAIFSSFYNCSVNVSEIECYSSGYDHCKFVISKSK